MTCTLKFKDGSTVTGKVTVESPIEQQPILYNGAVEKLPRLFKTATPALLRLAFKTIAVETQSQFEWHTEGTYDSGE